VKATPILEGIFTVDLPKIWSSPVLQNQSQGNHLDYETADYPVVDSMSLLPVSPHKENTEIRTPPYKHENLHEITRYDSQFQWQHKTFLVIRVLSRLRREPWFAHASADIQSAISDQNLFSQL
jgi:hypothetical protein